MNGKEHGSYNVYIDDDDYFGTRLIVNIANDPERLKVLYLRIAVL